MIQKRRTDNTMVKRRRTDNTMVKRRRTNNTMVKRRTDNTMIKRKRTERQTRGGQNTAQNMKDRAMRMLLLTGDKLGCSGKAINFSSTCDTRSATLVYFCYSQHITIIITVVTTVLIFSTKCIIVIDLNSKRRFLIQCSRSALGIIIISTKYV